MMIGIKSPFARRKKVEPPKHIKEQILEIMQQNNFKDRINVEDNAVQIMKSVKSIQKPIQVARKASNLSISKESYSTIGGRDTSMQRINSILQKDNFSSTVTMG
jgi:hypothetical protein